MLFVFDLEITFCLTDSKIKLSKIETITE